MIRGGRGGWAATTDNQGAARGVLKDDEPGPRQHAIQGLAGGVAPDHGIGSLPAHLVDPVNDLRTGMRGELAERDGRVATWHVEGASWVLRLFGSRRRATCAAKRGDEKGTIGRQALRHADTE